MEEITLKVQLKVDDLVIPVIYPEISEIATIKNVKYVNSDCYFDIEYLVSSQQVANVFNKFYRPVKASEIARFRKKYPHLLR